MKSVVVTPEGHVRFVYDEALTFAFRSEGPCEFRRASHVEPCPVPVGVENYLPVGWSVDLSPVGFAPRRWFQERETALAFERKVIEDLGIPMPMKEGAV